MMMRFLFAFFTLCATVSFAAVKPAPKAEQLAVTAQVYRIFEAKCVDCHGAHLPKPKGKFGYVLDLDRVGKNEDWITPGEPGTSDLYDMVVKNDMPGKDAPVPALTPEELKLVSRWIEMGAPGELPPPDKMPEAIAKVEAPKKPFLQRLTKWFGEFHAASTHFPVALLLIAVLAEAGAWYQRRKEWTFLTRFLVVIGALSSIPTAVLGWFNVHPVAEATAAVYNFHKWLGTGTAGWAVLCAFLICSNECAEGSFERTRFRGALLFGALLVSVTGFLGGALVAGSIDHYFHF